MNTAEILSIISICITSVFAIPPFIKMIVEFFHAKIKQKIVGVDFDEQNGFFILSLQIINYCYRPISIININVNNQNILIEDSKYFSAPLSKLIQANDNKVYRICCPKLKENEKIKIKLYTTKRRLRYKKSFKSIIQLLNEKGKE